MVYDAGKILVGLILFLGILTSPIWYNTVSGKATYKPEPKIVSQERQCIEPTPFMRIQHMTLLNNWRDSVVRKGAMLYEGEGGKTYDMSLTRTCMNCHSNKADFCDQCHNYLGVTPYCWDCHTYPREK